MLASPRFHSLYTIHLLELSPEVGGVLVVTGFLGTLRTFLDEAGQELCIVDFVAEHLFAASGVKWQLVSFIWISVQANFSEKIQAKDK